MTRFVGLDVSQKMTAICVVDEPAADFGGVSAPSVPEQFRPFCPPACG